MKITIVTNHFPPEIGGAVHLVYELAKNLKAFGHTVQILTGYPQYNLKSIPKKYKKGNLMTESLDGLPVIRIRFPNLPRGSKIIRGLQHFIYGIWLAALSLFSLRPDIILTYSPPLPLPWLISWVGKLRRIPVVVSIQDLFPLEAVELGILKNAMLISLFEAMEKQMYANAGGLTVHSPGNLAHVVANGGAKECINVVYNWVDTDRIRPGDKPNEFALKHRLLDRFVVSYAGTMGWAQDMATIVQCADLLKGEKKIVFLLVGDGVEKLGSLKECRRLGLNNIIWLPIQPWSVYPEILAASDVSMINLHPCLKTPVVPSKLINIMAAARPVIASLPEESDARRIIADANCGLCVPAGNAEHLAKAILKMCTNPQLAAKYGQRGRAFVEANFTQIKCSRTMETVLLKTVSKAQPQSEFLTVNHPLPNFKPGVSYGGKALNRSRDILEKEKNITEVTA